MPAEASSITKVKVENRQAGLTGSEASRVLWDEA